MKRLFLFAILFATQFLFAQSENDKKIFLDSLGNKTTEENHDFYIIIKDYNKELSEYETTSYYKSGKISSKSKTKTKNSPNNISSYFISYYESGIKKSEIFPQDINNPIMKRLSWFENGNLEHEEIVDFKKHISKTKDFYENGKPKSVEETSFQNIKKIIQFWDKNNNQLIINGNGDYYFEDDNLKITGKVSDSLKTGNWKTETKKDNSVVIEKYSKGILIKGINKTSNGEEFSYNELDSQPQPKKGIKHLTDYISKNFNPSKEAILNKVKGQIFIEFFVEEDGTISDIKVLRRLNYGLSEEAVRLIKEYNDWKPGELKGKKIKARFSIPIAIDLK